MKKSKKILLVILAALMLMSCVSCGKKIEKEFVGDWFNKSGKCLSIRSDGTFKKEGAYGAGTWKILDDGETIEMTDFYGSTTEIQIEKDDNGNLYISYEGTFYKNEYPENDTNDTTANNQNIKDETTNSGGNATVTTAPTKTSIDPFTGIQFTVSGISPYCTVTVNNANCSENAQQYVKYSLDKEYYKNGDIVKITASLLNSNSEEKYDLASLSYEYTIENQPQYITSLDSVDLTLLKAELADYIDSKIAKAKGNIAHGYMNVDLFGYDVGSPRLKSFDDITYLDSYLSVKKANKVYSTDGYYNILSFTLKIEGVKKSNNSKVVFYPCINAVNIIQNPDGSIRWGKDGSNNMGFSATSNKISLEDCVELEIMKNKINYNISKVET